MPLNAHLWKQCIIYLVYRRDIYMHIKRRWKNLVLKERLFYILTYNLQNFQTCCSFILRATIREIGKRSVGGKWGTFIYG